MAAWGSSLAGQSQDVVDLLNTIRLDSLQVSLRKLTGDEPLFIGDSLGAIHSRWFDKHKKSPPD